MRIEITKRDFLEIMENYRPHNFSLEGLRELYNYLNGNDQVVYTPNDITRCFDEGSINYFVNLFRLELEYWRELESLTNVIYVDYAPSVYYTLAEISAIQIICKIK